MNKKSTSKNKVISLFTLVVMSGFFFSCSSGTDFSLPSQNQQFSGQVYYNNKVDILFVVDNSKSMLQYQQRLSGKISDLVNTLNSLGMDYRVAVTTSTMATNTTMYPMSRQILGNPTYLTSANVSLLPNRIIVGESGSDLERSLDAMRYVTSETYLASINSNFLRSDALLSLIFISDEIDQSSEFGNPDSNDFVNYLDLRKPDFSNGTKAWVANYIGILTNQSCDALGGNVSIGTQYLKLVNASKGTKSSICNADLSAAVAGIRARIVDQLTAYRFPDVPNKSTLSVSVGGRTIVEDAVNGWTLETEANAVGQAVYVLKFHGDSIPAATEQVLVNYKASGAI